MKIKSIELHKIAKHPDHFCYDLPQIVFAGRSNVGKSSLIRCLANRKKLIRVGATPGVTQSINFYIINNEFYFVDLPGYGYAKTPKNMREQWRKLIETYFQDALDIRKVVFIIDIRHDPTENDIIFYKWAVDYHFPLLIVLTKYDKVSRNQALNARNKVIKMFSIKQEDCVLFSAISGNGRNELLSLIDSAIKRDNVI